MKKRLAKKIYYSDNNGWYWLKKWLNFEKKHKKTDHRIYKAIRRINKLIETKNNDKD